MLYSLYELNHAAMTPFRAVANASARFWRSPINPASNTLAGRSMAAALDVFESATRRYAKPEWELDETLINGKSVPVTPETLVSKPFCRLVRFTRDEAALKAARGDDAPDPRVLIVAPMSGHFATLLRGTVEAMLPDHEVYVTDWADARLVPINKGRFDLNDYVDYVIEFLQTIGPKAHVMGVCQPGPAVLAAVSLMSEDEDPNLPASMVFMGSPIDARQSPTVPNKLAMERPVDWFRENMIYTVPLPHAGVLRRVYPGFIQLYSFLSMNSDRHIGAQYKYFEHLVQGDGESAQKHREFYDEYLAVLDLTEEFYVQTIDEVFQKFSLAKGVMVHRDRIVRTDAVKNVALMTVEGENDDISGIGQTQAAHTLCAGIPAEKKIDYVQPKVGHYGVFNGSRWRNEIQPRIAHFFRKEAGFSVKSEREVRKKLDLRPEFVLE
ncbi:MAG: polyhydroxyalkanoate depolymerase [Pseudomonadota bacterium]